MSQKVSLMDVDGVKYPLVYRPGTSDVKVAKVIFEKLCYMIFQDWLAPPKIADFEPEFIIDGGANVGYASVFFANVYPSAKKIIAVEPEVDNFELVKYNAKPYPQIEPIRAALWSKETDLSVEMFPLYCSPTGYITKDIDQESPEEITHAVTIEKLLHDSGFKYIDILKLDVESAEKEIFSDESNYQSWLPYTKILMIELHDRMKRGCSRNFFRAISWYEYFSMIIEENLVLIREDLL